MRSFPAPQRSAINIDGLPECLAVSFRPLKAVHLVLTSNFAAPDGLAGTIPHNTHRMRRAAVNPYFSKQSVKRLEPVIQGSLSRLLNRMENARHTGEIMRLPIVFKALTCDIIQDYAFGTPEKHMDHPEYSIEFFEAVAAFIEGSHLLLHLGWVGPLTEALPIAITHRLLPAMAGLYKMRQVSHFNYLTTTPKRHTRN